MAASRGGSVIEWSSSVVIGSHCFEACAENSTQKRSISARSHRLLASSTYSIGHHQTIKSGGRMRTQSPQMEERLPPVGSSCSRSRVFCFALALLGLGSGANGQGLSVPPGASSAPVFGGAGGVPPPAQLPLLNGIQSTGAKKHLGPTGKPCLRVQGYAKPQVINNHIFEHMIMASNDCSQPIKIQVCYYQSHQCIPLNVPGYGHQEVVLGIMPAMDQFQFEYREQFDQGMGSLGGGLN